MMTSVGLDRYEEDGSPPCLNPHEICLFAMYFVSLPLTNGRTSGGNHESVVQRRDKQA